MRQIFDFERPRPVVCCASCASRPRFMAAEGEFMCSIIEKVMRNSENCGCVNWKEAHE